MWGSKPKKIVLKLWGLMLFTQLGFGLIDFGIGMFILQLPHHCLWKTHHSLLDFTGSQLEDNLSWDEGYIWYILYHLNQISVFLIPDLDDSWMKLDLDFYLILEKVKASRTTGMEWVCFTYRKRHEFVGSRDSMIWSECLYLPNSYVKILMPDVMILVGGAFRGCLNHEHGALITQISAF